VMDALSSTGVDNGVEPLEEGGRDVLISGRTGLLSSTAPVGAAAGPLWLGSAGCIFGIADGWVPAQAGLITEIYILFVAAASKQTKERKAQFDERFGFHRQSFPNGPINSLLMPLSSPPMRTQDCVYLHFG